MSTSCLFHLSSNIHRAHIKRLTLQSSSFFFLFCSLFVKKNICSLFGSVFLFSLSFPSFFSLFFDPAWSVPFFNTTTLNRMKISALTIHRHRFKLKSFFSSFFFLLFSFFSLTGNLRPQGTEASGSAPASAHAVLAVRSSPSPGMTPPSLAT